MEVEPNVYSMKNDSPSSELFPDNPDMLSEQDLYVAIRDRVEYFLEHNPELLMSYLYRLDVLEEKINAVLSPTSPVPPLEGLSRLILERQKERIATKKKFKSDPPIPGWEF